MRMATITLMLLFSVGPTGACASHASYAGDKLA